jgi:hypothetical protein
MRFPKSGAFLLAAATVILLFAGEALARVTLFIGPWWPVPVIVAPIYPQPYLMPPPPPPVAAPPVGYVDTNVQPKDAQVIVDGAVRGMAYAFDGAPAYLDLPPGRHRIEFTREGFEPVALVVFVEPGEVVSVDLSLKEARGKGAPPEEKTYQLETQGTGFVQLEIEPSDAAVYIDDAFYGPASQFRDAGHKIMLRAGRHTVEIGRPGYVLYRGTVTIEATETTVLEVTLEK